MKLEPGLWKATVRGVANQIVLVGSACYVHIDSTGHLMTLSSKAYPVTDARPLTVLDLDDPRRLQRLVRDAGLIGLADQIEVQIKVQIKPARIPEPGLWGVVRASIPSHEDPSPWVRDAHGVRPWASLAGYAPQRWDDLIDPILLREGVS